MLSIIIINYNTFKLTCQCIDSFLTHVSDVDYEIIIVDNYSSEADPKKFLEIFPKIRLIESQKNLGFAGGNNLGISHASGDYILLLNSDTYMHEDCVSPALNMLSTRKEIGALSIRILYPDGTFQHTARRFRSIRNETLDLVRPLLLLMPYRKRSQLMLNQYFKGDFDTPCDWVSGAFMMFRRELLQQMKGGILDERFFMYGEDQLWCYQFMRAGFKNFFLSSATVYHIANASTAPEKQLKLKKTMIKYELEILKAREKSKLYILAFKCLFLPKEYTIYIIKLLAFRLFKYKIR